jgi:hypothetical protein
MDCSYWLSPFKAAKVLVAERFHSLRNDWWAATSVGSRIESGEEKDKSHVIVLSVNRWNIFVIKVR